MVRPLPSAALLLGLFLLNACSLRQLAVRAAARSLAGGSDVYASEEDPDLVRGALPFVLKTEESLLAQDPRNPDLLLAAASGFTQYSYAFVAGDAAAISESDYGEAERLRERARRLYLRARGYGLRGLEIKHPGLGERLRSDPVAASAAIARAELPFLFWTAAAWGSAISQGKDHPELIADLPVVRALLERALALDEGFMQGAIHAALVSLEALPAAMGGSAERARQHFERAVELSGGQDAALFVTYAETTAVPAQDRAAFDHLLDRALAIEPDRDPPRRLANLIAQRRARLLRARADTLFLEPAAEPGHPASAHVFPDRSQEVAQ